MSRPTRGLPAAGSGGSGGGFGSGFGCSIGLLLRMRRRRQRLRSGCCICIAALLSPCKSIPASQVVAELYHMHGQLSTHDWERVRKRRASREAADEPEAGAGVEHDADENRG